ncbi:NADH-quinone oxidoreductase subunit L, partial [Fischerella thermalis CCMEE 5319]
MDLTELQEIAEKERANFKPIRIRCCMAAGCLSSGSVAVKESLEKVTEETGLADKVEVCSVGCMGLCCQGPLVEVDNVEASGLVTQIYEKVTSENAPSIIAGLDGGEVKVQTGDLQQPFFTKQLPIVLENSGKVDPERIESYIAADGYQALYHVLREMTPAEVVDAITRSGLRGRGGAGYPTGVKWATVAKAKGDRKFVICNADEGDPGAFMDRSVLESDPHRV